MLSYATGLYNELPVRLREEGRLRFVDPSYQATIFRSLRERIADAKQAAYDEPREWRACWKEYLDELRQELTRARLRTGFLRIKPPLSREAMYQRLKAKILAKPEMLNKIAESLQSDDIVD